MPQTPKQDWRTRQLNWATITDSIWGPAAEDLYVRRGLSIDKMLPRLNQEYDEEIHGNDKTPSRGTLFRWSNLRNWKEMRAEFNSSSIALDMKTTQSLEFLIDEMHRAQKRLDLKEVKSLALSITNLQKVRRTLNPEKDFRQNTLAVIDTMTQYLIQHNPEFARWFRQHIDTIYTTILERNGIKS